VLFTQLSNVILRECSRFVFAIFFLFFSIVSSYAFRATGSLIAAGSIPDMRGPGGFVGTTGGTTFMKALFCGASGSNPLSIAESMAFITSSLSRNICSA